MEKVLSTTAEDKEKLFQRQLRQYWYTHICNEVTIFLRPYTFNVLCLINRNVFNTSLPLNASTAQNSCRHERFF